MPYHHSGLTRFLHGALAISVGVQLMAGLVMQAPSADHAGNNFFTIHTRSDILTGALAFTFWLLIVTRHSGTAAGLLFPWFNAGRKAALFADARRHWAALRRGHLAAFQPAAPLAAAMHGLGLVLVTGMSATGVSHMMAAMDGPSAATFDAWLRWLHGLTGILVWLFLIGHGLLAVLHHYAGDLELQSIWSLGTSEVDGVRRDDP